MELENKRIDNFIITGTTFKSKMECFEYFKELIKEETFELVNENTEKVPLNKVNELIEEDYIYVYIINELEEEGGCKNSLKNNDQIWIRDAWNEDLEEFIGPFLHAEYVFLFIEENEEYKFLGLYKLMSTDIDGYCKEWEKQDENMVSLDEMEIKKTIEKINYSYIEEYVNDREKLKEILKEHGERYAYLPYNLKNDEELCLISAESTNGFACKFAGKELLNNKEFAKRVLKEYPDDLKYFSDEIKKDKALVLEILKEEAYDIKYVDKELRKDKDICYAYWDYVKKNLHYAYYSNICSVIGIDAFGNEVINTFLKIEQERHTEETISQYQEKTELVQFVKTEETIVYEETNSIISVLDKKIFDKELKPLIVLIGEKENAISKQIKQEYQKNSLSNKIFIIEIYKQDTNTYNPKLITKDIEKIMDLMRIVTYNNKSKNTFILDELFDIKRCLKLSKTKNIEIYKCEGTIKEVKQKINQVLINFSNKFYMIQLVYNNNIDVYTINSIGKMVCEASKSKYIGYYADCECNIKDIEVTIMLV